MFFTPGYALLAALMPGRRNLNGVERVALSIALSIVQVAFIGLALNFSPFGLTLKSGLFAILPVIAVEASIAVYRRRRQPRPVETGPGGGTNANHLLLQWTGRSSLSKVISILLAVGILGSLTFLSLAASSPRGGERFTEFYVLGQDGMAANYPLDVAPGEQLTVKVGIVNREGDPVQYRVEVVTGEATLAKTDTEVLQPGRKWEQAMSFAMTGIGESQKVEFRLYKGNEPGVYLTVHLWLNVRAAGRTGS